MKLEQCAGRIKVEEGAGRNRESKNRVAMRSRGLSTDGKYERMQGRMSEGLGGKTPVTCRLDGAVVSIICSTHRVPGILLVLHIH